LDGPPAVGGSADPLSALIRAEPESGAAAMAVWMGVCVVSSST
jgi:hypothetical protein